MTAPDACGEIQARVDAYADGTAEDRAVVDRHVATCDRCRRSLAIALAVQRSLTAPVSPPASLSRKVLSRVRHDRWRAEQQFDVVFNLAMAAVFVLVVAGILSVLYLSGLGALVLEASALVGDGLRTLTLRSPRLTSAVGLSAGLVAAGLGLWWWSERRTIG